MTHKQLDYYEVMDRKNEVKFEKKIVLLLDDLRLPPNIAGIFRLSDGLQVSKVLLLCNEEFAFSKKFRSISRIHEEHIDYELVNEEKAIAALKQYANDGYHIAALEYTDQSVDLSQLKEHDKYVIIAGAEKYGIRPSFLAEAEESVHIPMQGALSSLNVMQSVSIAVYEIRRRELNI